jgi:hypothetical protein
MMKSRICAARFSAVSLALSMLCAAPYASAQAAMPEGMKGWWYYTGVNTPDQFAADPLTACRLTAQNHARAPLLAMRPTPGTNGVIMDCKYVVFLPKEGDWYGPTSLFCNVGYLARWPGVCVKREEPPAPPSCSSACPGYAEGNPVQLASGAKVQTETDLTAGPGALLTIQRTYRSLRRNWRAQSASYGWSFSFDRDFTVEVKTSGTIVSGSFGDGSAFAFDVLADGRAVSRYDKRLSLAALSPAHDDWILTAIDGQVERYKKINGVFRMVSAHRATGESATFSYDTDNQLIRIVDDNGRSINITWRDALVESIGSANGGVRYEYEQATVPEQGEIAGMARLAAVHFNTGDGALISSRRYHYEHELLRYLLTGVTDENNTRFSTYAYNGAPRRCCPSTPVAPDATHSPTLPTLSDASPIHSAPNAPMA